MPVNIEIKGNLARLLATENLIVEHKQVETAQFNTDTRVLTLPMWNTSSNYVYDMLVAHEVGHALFTPCVMWKEGKYESLPHPYVNVIEDVRIERFMKNKFAGLNRDFYKGYEELNASDFFELDGINVNNMKLIDKINLYFKVGAYLCIEFNDIENEFVTQASKTETFEDVLDLANRIYLYSKAQQERKQKELQEQKQQQEGNGQSGDDADLDTPSFEKSDDGEGDNGEMEGDIEYGDENETSLGNEAGNWNDMDESDTQEAFDRNSDRLKDSNDKGRETTYVSIPELNLDNVVISFDTVYKELKEHFDQEMLIAPSEKQYSWAGDTIEQANSAYRVYKKSASKDVNNLVKEFEMRKSADSYARQGVSKTGVLDTSKLHTYMFNEDIFKKVTTIPEGKNHGLVFLLDWSGSMQYNLKDTIKQLYNLVWFCRKVNIPFEVYAFSNDAWALGTDNRDTQTGYQDVTNDERLVKEMKIGDLHIEGQFRMVNIITSTAKTKQLDEMMTYLWLQVSAFEGYRYQYHRKFSLSGTPLNEAIIAVGQLTKQLIKRSKLQKCHVIALTDGEGFHISYNAMRTKYTSNEQYMGACGFNPYNTVIRHNGKTFLGAMNEPDFTCKLVEAVKSDIPNCNFIAIRLLEKGGLHRFYSWYARKSFATIDEAKGQLRKNGLLSFSSLSFDMWFAMQGKSMHTDDELDVDQGADKRKIMSSFKRMNRNKKTNKFLVKQFIKQIA